MTTPETAARPAGRCPAAHPNDPTPCDGPAVVTVLDAVNAGADGCEHHGARLLATLEGGRVYRLPDAPDGAAIRVFKAAGATRPFSWLTNAPRTAPNLFSLTEDTRSERMLTMTDPAHTIDLARGLVTMLRAEHVTDGHDDMLEDLLAIIDRQAVALRSSAVLLRSAADKVDGQWTQLTGIDPAPLRAAAQAADDLAGPAAH